MVGTVTVKAPDMAAFNAAATAVLNDAALETALVGDAVRNPVADALDRRARRNAGIDLMDQAQKFDFARDTIAGRESSAWDER